MRLLSSLPPLFDYALSLFEEGFQELWLVIRPSFLSSVLLLLFLRVFYPISIRSRRVGIMKDCLLRFEEIS